MVLGCIFSPISLHSFVHSDKEFSVSCAVQQSDLQQSSQTISKSILISVVIFVFTHQTNKVTVL